MSLLLDSQRNRDKKTYPERIITPAVITYTTHQQPISTVHNIYNKVMSKKGWEEHTEA